RSDRGRVTRRGARPTPAAFGGGARARGCHARSGAHRTTVHPRAQRPSPGPGRGRRRALELGHATANALLTAPAALAGLRHQRDPARARHRAPRADAGDDPRVHRLRPGQRLPEDGGVEVTALVRAFNQMLDRLESERRQSGRRALQAQEAERLRIARGLHDEVGQVLTGVLLQLDSLATAGGDRAAEIAETKAAVRGAVEEVRRIARELRPEMLEQLGLVSALTELSRRFADQS